MGELDADQWAGLDTDPSLFTHVEQDRQSHLDANGQRGSR